MQKQERKRKRKSGDSKRGFSEKHCNDSIASNFVIIMRALFYKKPILPAEDTDFLMRQSSPRLVDRAHWQFTY